MNEYHYYRRMPHLQGRGGAIFVTFGTLARRPLEDICRDMVLQHCLRADGAQYHLTAAVIMPDHVHMIITPLIIDRRYFPLQKILKALKGSSARSINGHRGENGPVWQEESFDRVLRNNEQLSKAVEYIAENPVAAGLTEVPSHYRWLWLR